MTATCCVAAILAVDVVGYSRLVSFWWRRMRLGGRIGGFVGALVLLANGATASDVSVERGLGSGSRLSAAATIVIRKGTASRTAM
jgi:hypothetical protein